MKWPTLATVYRDDYRIAWTWRPTEFRLWLYRGPYRCLEAGEWDLCLGFVSFGRRVS